MLDSLAVHCAPKGNQCKAIVIQRGDTFQQRKQEHNHPPVVGSCAGRNKNLK